MKVRPFAVAAGVVCLGLMLGSCSPFAGFMADHWPHWAGGMPNDVPPRPGAPGYNEFIAHGEAARGVEPAPPVNLPPATGARTSATIAPPAGRPPDNPNVGQGGLY